MPPTKRQEAEAILPDLDRWLAARHQAGYSWNEIAFSLRTFGITVTGETCRQWHADESPGAA